ncbi:MAG TPA: aldo/keto reductase [Microbacteriaceae bacterium]|nr:aldo/keto reductase [Microbacteriaceae bacterium]
MKDRSVPGAETDDGRAPGAIPTLRLNDGARLPQIGLGTWPLDDDEVEEAIVAAARLGYRHIDTGEPYGNEVGVGRGVRSSNLPRSEFFISTKLDGKYQGGDRAIAGLEGSLERMQLDYVDLVLIHWPLPLLGEYVSTWHTFETLLARGLTKSIGVSNFAPAHLAKLIAESSIVPAVNQIQVSPHVPRADYLAFHEQHGIATIAWSPLGGGTLLTDPVITKIAAEHDVSPAQVVLRWYVQQGMAAVPKTKNPARMLENRTVFDFQLTSHDMVAMKSLAGGAEAVDPETDGH